MKRDLTFSRGASSAVSSMPSIIFVRIHQSCLPVFVLTMSWTTFLSNHEEKKILEEDAKLELLCIILENIFK